MSSFNTHQSIVQRLKELSDKLASSKLTKEELEEFEVRSRDLYERALILNYKAKESNVYADKQDSKKEFVSPETTHEVVQPVEEEESKPINNEPVEPAPVEVEKEEPAPAPGEIQFDFSSTDDDEETSAQEEEEAPVQTKEEPQVETSVSEEVEQEESEPKETQPEESPVSEVEETVADDSIAITFYERFSQIHKEAQGDVLGAAKIDNISGAIGLNDKLQFIGELFDGNADQYKETISTLNQLEKSDDARQHLSEIATQQKWDVEEPIVDEFLRVINRRYEN